MLRDRSRLEFPLKQGIPLITHIGAQIQFLCWVWAWHLRFLHPCPYAPVRACLLRSNEVQMQIVSMNVGRTMDGPTPWGKRRDQQRKRDMHVAQTRDGGGHFQSTVGRSGICFRTFATYASFVNLYIMPPQEVNPHFRTYTFETGWSLALLQLFETWY